MAAGKLSLIAFELSAVRLTEGETTQCMRSILAHANGRKADRGRDHSMQSGPRRRFYHRQYSDFRRCDIRILVVEEFGFSQLTNSDC